jgi:hypothetical protein
MQVKGKTWITKEQADAKDKSVKGHGDKRQFTLLATTSAAGDTHPHTHPTHHSSRAHALRLRLTATLATALTTALTTALATPHLRQVTR